MEWQILPLIIVGALLLLMVAGLPVALCFLAVDLVCVYVFWGGFAGIEQLAISIQGGLATFVLLPIPLFILMGELIASSGFASEMLKAVDQWLGRLPGRLSFVAVLGGVLIATLTGTNIASVTLLGNSLLPDMEKKMYKPAMSLGPIIGSSCLAMMVPPSAPAVLLGAIAEVSVGKLLIAIIMPGILLAVLYTIYIFVRAFLQPELAPAYEAPKVSLKIRINDTLKNILPVGVIIFLVVGVMFLGIAGPSEAAATGAVGTLLLCAARRSLNWTIMRKVLLSTTKITVMMFMIMAGSKAFSQILAYTGASDGLIGFLTEYDVSPMATLLIMQVIILIMGSLMDAMSIMMITIPVFMPIIHELGYDPIWFCVIFLINLDIGGLTPPFGLALFAMKGVAPKYTMSEIIKASFPFLVLDIFAIALIMVFPYIATWLPAVMR